jgi:hypothetical protein
MKKRSRTFAHSRRREEAGDAVPRTQPRYLGCYVAAAMLAFAANAFAANEPVPVHATKGGALEYLADARGNRVPDFSHAGYAGGGVPLPLLPPRVTVSPVEGDDGARIQAAIDYVSSLELDANGFRGAVQLTTGRFDVAGQIRIAASGVVLRGSGAEAGGTVLVATGTDRRTLIEVAGADRRRKLAEPVAVTDNYVPVNAKTLRVAHAKRFSVGQSVVVERASTSEWIETIGMDWAPGRQN